MIKPKTNECLLTSLWQSHYFQFGVIFSFFFSFLIYKACYLNLPEGRLNGALSDIRTHS